MGALTDREHRFPGQWFQPETALHQNWHRDYDPTTGRYLQPDPLGLIDGPAAYNYAMQSPMRYIDPTGLISFADIGYAGLPQWIQGRVQYELNCIISNATDKERCPKPKKWWKKGAWIAWLVCKTLFKDPNVPGQAPGTSDPKAPKPPVGQDPTDQPYQPKETSKTAQCT